MKKFLLIFFLAIISCLQANSGPGLDRFHICTIATKHHPNLDKLLKSCKRQGIHMDVIAMGRPYYFHGTKFIYLEEYLSKLNDDDIVMFVDGFDVLILANKEEIYSKFLAMNSPFVMAAEKNCAPNPSVAGRYPKSPTRYKYVNTGTFIGYVRNIKKLPRDLSPVDPNANDQEIVTYHFLDAPVHQKPFKLDYKCELFFPLYQVKKKEIAFDNKRKRVICKATKTRPCVIHANGSSFKIYNKAYRKFIK